MCQTNIAESVTEDRGDDGTGNTDTIGRTAEACRGSIEDEKAVIATCDVIGRLLTYPAVGVLGK